MDLKIVIAYLLRIYNGGAECERLKYFCCWECQFIYSS